MTIHQTQNSFGFSGSYHPSDVTFLLQPLSIETTSVEEKEKLIQSGASHYSEMIGEEKAPTSEYKKIFADAMDRGARRLAEDVARMAFAIELANNGPITLISLVRAGTPVGVLLQRALVLLGRDVVHFGVSIIRDRGLDEVAMDHILQHRPIDGLVFVDGWTGKGAISTELERSFRRYSSAAPRLAVVADPCGRAWLAASGEDWLIPSGILGSTVSGLISRTILNDQVIASGGFHGCREWRNLADHDISRSFVDEVSAYMYDYMGSGDFDPSPAEWSDSDRTYHGDKARQAVSWVAERHAVTNINRIKPGIAEATRAVLRRVPEKVYISDRADPDLAALIHLLQQKNVPFEVARSAIVPYKAITLIGQVS